MIRVLQQLQCSPLAQALHDRLQQIECRELIARSLQKQHRDRHARQMIGALLRRTSGGMQREREKRQARDPWQGRERLRLRCHAAAERSAACDQSQARRQGGQLRRRRRGPWHDTAPAGPVVASRAPCMETDNATSQRPAATDRRPLSPSTRAACPPRHRARTRSTRAHLPAYRAAPKQCSSRSPATTAAVRTTGSSGAA